MKEDYSALKFIPCFPLATPRRLSKSPSDDEGGGGGGMTVVDEESGGGGGGGTDGEQRPVRGRVTLSG